MRLSPGFFSLLVIIPLFNQFPSPGNAQSLSSPPNDSEIIQTAKEAYIFGYPLVMMEITRRVMTNYENATDRGAPMNQISRKETFPDEKFTAVVKPNCDTYYALAWLDLRREPLVLEIPNTNGRYFLLPIVDAWTNVIASPGKRTTGTAAQKFLITGPGWKGKIPKGMTELHSPTNMAWMAGRTQVNSKDDGVTVVKAIQEGYRLIPLSSYGKQYDPPPGKVDSLISMNPPVKHVFEMPVDAYFNLLNQLMIDNRPAPADSAIVKRIARLGILPGGTFDLKKFSMNVQDSISAIPSWFKKYMADLALKKEKINGWTMSRGLGDYGTNYDLRAMIANRGLGANLDADALYPLSVTDIDGEKYDGSKHQYVLHFDAGKIPPANAFWSLTMYGMDNFLAANPINRFAIGDRNDLKKNPDGSLDIFIQNNSPGEEKASNWLPAPAAPFNLMLRIYWPDESVLNGSWIPPAVVKVK
jgi:hypothetical protein